MVIISNYLLLSLLIVFVIIIIYRSGDEQLLMSILTPLNVNGHACDGRKVSSVLKVMLVCQVCDKCNDLFKQQWI